LSAPPDATHPPSGANPTVVTSPSCAGTEATSNGGPQRRRVPSRPPLASSDPSGENARAVTAPWGPSSNSIGGVGVGWCGCDGPADAAASCGGHCTACRVPPPHHLATPPPTIPPCP